MNIIITGTSRGIGNALARVFLKKGHNVWGVSRPPEKKEQKEPFAKEASLNYKHSYCDISQLDDIEKFRAEIVNANFSPDLIYLNAAIEYEDVNATINRANLDKTMNTNLIGSLLFVSVFMEEFVKVKKGKFIAISSLFDQWPDTNSPVYAASKAGLLMAFRGFKLKYKTLGIHFQIVSLGPINTSINKRFDENPTENKKPWIVEPADVASYLFSKINNNKTRLYYPIYIDLVYKFLFWLPDTLFEQLTSSFKR